MESILCSNKVTCSANSLSFQRNNHLLGLDEKRRKKSITQQIVSSSRRSRLILLSANNSVKSNTITCFSLNSKPLKMMDYLGHHVPDDWTKWTSVTTSSTCENSVEHHANVPSEAVDGSAAIIDGKTIATTIKSEIASDITRMKNSIGKCPRLAIVMVGEREDSDTLVRLKKKACKEVGIVSSVVELPDKSTKDELRNIVSDLNRDPEVHGVMVQLPLPQHLDEEKIMNVIDPKKDVDGFHPLNMGNLALKGREPFFIPCSAKACIHLLLRHDIELEGKNVVVIGRSKIVGLPTLLLLQAIVSLVNSFTKNPQYLTSEADIVITDISTPDMVRGDWLKRGAVVIDAGTGIKDSHGKPTRPLRGDVCYEEAVHRVSAITPVPGGLGPVIIAMLLSNTLDSAKRLTNSSKYLEGSSSNLTEISKRFICVS